MHWQGLKSAPTAGTSRWLLHGSETWVCTIIISLQNRKVISSEDSWVVYHEGIARTLVRLVSLVNRFWVSCAGLEHEKWAKWVDALFPLNLVCRSYDMASSHRVVCFFSSLSWKWRISRVIFATYWRQKYNNSWTTQIQGLRWVHRPRVIAFIPGGLHCHILRHAKFSRSCVAIEGEGGRLCGRGRVDPFCGRHDCCGQSEIRFVFLKPMGNNTARLATNVGNIHW